MFALQRLAVAARPLTSLSLKTTSLLSKRAFTTESESDRPESSGYTKVVMVGNVGREPEYYEFAARENENDAENRARRGVWRISLAVGRYVRRLDDEINDWYTVKVYGNHNSLSDQVVAGSKVLVEGKLRTWRLTDKSKSGVEVLADKVKVLVPKLDTDAELEQQSLAEQQLEESDFRQ
ncbi:hypothetical protein HK102_009859 [Quaeritorhiza haematococci]|nr:hypothetical protein HK102_009859 [Quaeritorhiza haematococci]